MEKKEAQDLTRALVNLVNTFKEINKNIDIQNRIVRENNEALKNIYTRLGSLINSMSSGSSITNV